jgi:predicted nucleic acid-binding protein
MDRLLLDANVLFSAAWRENAGMLRLWKLHNVTLCSSWYALAEAHRNLKTEDQCSRLTELSKRLHLYDASPAPLPAGISLPEKDAPILLAAMRAGATHLLTGDLDHFGPYFGERIAGILIQPPGKYLRSR